MMKKLTSAMLLTTVLVVTAMAGQAQNSATKQNPQPAITMSAKAAKAKAQESTNCQPQNAGVRCNRPKPRKPWFFGK